MLRKMSTTASNIARQLKLVSDKIQTAAAKRPENLQYVTPRLVAVSKTKSIDMIMEAYDAGQRHFGENYVVEICNKAHDIELQDRCEDISWHFIGHLQRNKVSKLLDIPNLYVIETVDSERLAKAINDTWQRLGKSEPLRIMAQFNTSGEENKNGCSQEEAVNIVRYIKEECPNLNLMGIMTIGSFDHDLSKGPNPDFQCLIRIREEVCKALDIPEKDLELSMGMSADYQHAIEMGSTNVRVGSTIFGSRNTQQSGQQAETSSTQASTEASERSTEKVVNAELKPEHIQNLALS